MYPGSVLWQGREEVVQQGRVGGGSTAGQVVPGPITRLRLPSSGHYSGPFLDPFLDRFLARIPMKRLKSVNKPVQKWKTKNDHLYHTFAHFCTLLLDPKLWQA